MLRAILISYERVLVDVEESERRVWSDVLGRPIAPAEWSAKAAGREPREALLGLLGHEAQHPEEIRRLLAVRSGRVMERAVATGVVELIHDASRRAPLGLWFGAPREEVVAVLKSAAIFDRFTALSPGGIASALKAINADLERLRREPATPRGTLALAGDRSAVAEARSMGVRVVAVGERVGGADAHAPGARAIDLEELSRSLF